MGALAWGRKVSPQFARKVIALAEALGRPPSDLMSCMAFESRETFSSSVVNRVSGATGLIQFMPATARAMGTTTAELALLTPEEQLDYVARYFAPYRGRLKSLDDVYMAILWPKAVGKPSDTVLFAGKTKQYIQNRGLDLDGNNAVTKAEAARKVRDKLRRGMRPEFCLDLDAELEESADADAPEAVEEAIPLPRDRPEDAPPIEREIADLAAESVGRVGPAALTSDEIVRTKHRLRQMNIHEVGDQDDPGIGSRSEAGVTAFMRERGLAGPRVFDRAFVGEVDRANREGWTRPIAEKRSSATAEELAPKNETLWSIAKTKALHFWSMICAAVIAAFNWIASQLEGNWFLLDRAGDFVKNIPVWGWAGIAAVLLAVGLHLTKRGESDQVGKYNRGELL